MGITFLDLPLDIHLTILSELRPVDILALRQTCTLLAEASRERTVWKEALQWMCYQNMVFLPTFDVANMTVKELETAAMAPVRWELLMTSDRGTQPLAVRTRLLDSTGISFQQLYLVPGGRFLLTLHGSNTITLWDLSRLPDTTDGTEPTSSGTTPLATLQKSCDYFYASPIPGDETSFRVLVNSSARTQSIHIYDIAPTAPSPSFRCINSIDVGGTELLGLFSICDDRLIMVEDSLALIWNFKQNTWAIWDVGRSLWKQFYIKDDIIAFIDSTDVVLWKIPPLNADARELATKLGQSVPSVPPNATLSFSDTENGTTGDADECQGPCDWYTGGNQPIWFDMVELEESDNDSEYEPPYLIMTRYQIDLPTNPSPGLEEVKAVPQFRYVPPTNVGNEGGYRVCGDNFVTWWYSDEPDSSTGVRCLTGRMDIAKVKNQTPILNEGAFLCSTEYNGYHATSLCPIAGRLAYIASQECEVFIIDYIP